MLPTLLIRLLPAGAAEWLALGRDGRVLAGPQAGWPGERAEQVWVVVPGEDVLLLRAPRVARQRRQLEQAVPFAIEEQLVAPVEQQHVALSQAAAGADLAVAVVAQARMEAWLAALRGAGLEPDRLVADVDLLPWAEGRPTVLVDGSRALLRWSESGALAGNLEEIGAWLSLPGVLPAGAPLHWIGPPAAAPAGVALEREEAGAPLRWFAARLAQAQPIELLQGRHAARRGRDSARSLWRWAAALGLAALLGALLHVAFERAQLEARHAEQRAEMEQLLLRAVPGTTRVVDPKAQLAAEFARLGRGGGGGALPLLARIAPSIAGSGRFTLDGIEFRGDTLELVVRGPDVATLDGLREALAGLSLQVELTSANPGAGGVEGRLRIRSGT
jgi:general secretion pathway protein L